MKNDFSRRQFLGSICTATAAGIIGTTPIESAARPGSSKSHSPIATTEFGKVQGVDVGGVSVFMGIPYGGPTERIGRFMPPRPPEKCKGIRDCTKLGPRAMQSTVKLATGHEELAAYFGGGRPGAEDKLNGEVRENCLVLNVVSPGLRGKRAVMVYIHGGGFTTGSGGVTTMADRLVAEEDIVLVGVNHRLNVFGYTYLGDLDPRFADSGNLGQLDLIAALEWVKRNISHFGGDPNNVTIFGESGGGAKISCLLAMPRAKGLFRRAIIESGAAKEVRTKEGAVKDTEKLLAKLGLSKSQVSELQRIPADKLIAASADSGLMGTGPVVDGRSIPHQTWKTGAPPEAAGVALMVGHCKDESTLFAALLKMPVFDLTWQSLREQLVKGGIAETAVDAIVTAYREDYSKESPTDLFFRISSDRGARRNAQFLADAKVAQGNGNVYMYNFAWNTPVEGGRFRAFHTAELPLVFRLVSYPQSDPLSRQVAGAWAAFARTGDPNHKGLPAWEPYTLPKRATMVFDLGNTHVENDPARRQMVLLKDYPGAFL